MRIVLVSATTGYQVRSFAAAARRMGVECVLATDRCHVLEDPWADRAFPVEFDHPAESAALVEGPYDGIVAVGDRPALMASHIAGRLGLRFHPRQAVATANDKHLTRRAFQKAGLLTPGHTLAGIQDEPVWVAYPCVLKALHLSASRGVIRANNPAEYRAARDRIAAMVPDRELQVESYIPGREFALEGLVRDGVLQVLSVFDKPDPLEGPFFEETIYVTPPGFDCAAIEHAAQRAVAALGLSDGPVHAEMRVNSEGVWMLEVAARPIGGLCAGVLRFEPGGISLEELILRHALGEDTRTYSREARPSGVMMIPVPRAGILEAVHGIENARATGGIDDVVITAKIGQELVPLPEGASYPGFLFAHGETAQAVTAALREAHRALRFEVLTKLPVI